MLLWYLTTKKVALTWLNQMDCFRSSKVAIMACDVPLHIDSLLHQGVETNIKNGFDLAMCLCDY